jgi:hypothetical protein
MGSAVSTHGAGVTVEASPPGAIRARAFGSVETATPLIAAGSDEVEGKHADYVNLCTKNNFSFLRGVVLKAGKTPTGTLVSELATLAFQRRRMERLSKRLEKGPGGEAYVFAALVREAKIHFRKPGLREYLSYYVVLSIEEAWTEAGLPPPHIPEEGLRRAQRAETRKDCVPEHAVRVLQSLSGEDQSLFALGFLCKIRWGDVGRVLGMTAAQARDRADGIMDRCWLALQEYSMRELKELPHPDIPRNSERAPLPIVYEGTVSRIVLSNAAGRAVTRADLGAENSR